MLDEGIKVSCKPQHAFDLLVGISAGKMEQVYMPIYHAHVFKCDFTHKNPYILSRQDKTCGTGVMYIMLQTLFMQGNYFDHLMLFKIRTSF